MTKLRILRQIRLLVGAIIFDLFPFLQKVFQIPRRKQGNHWVYLKNRNEVISVSDKVDGVRCDWSNTSVLHATSVFPYLSGLLIKRMVTDWPFLLPEINARSQLKKDVSSEPPSRRERVSFVIGHSGSERLQHLLFTLRSIAGQVDCDLECIVVEQSIRPMLAEVLPNWIKYLHIPTTGANCLYNRSRGFNVGARACTGEILVLHDGDILVPSAYAKEIVQSLQLGYQVTNLKRFIAFLDKSSTGTLFESSELPEKLYAEKIMANATGGGSIAITRKAYWELGGMDEDFEGWGGEDTEFWDRCSVLNVNHFGYLPLLHLWHPPQTGKAEIEGLSRSTIDTFRQKMEMPKEHRIRLLKARDTQ